MADNDTCPLRRVLVVRWGVPRPDTNAADRRLVALIELMCRRHRVTLCCPTTETEEGLDGALLHADKLRALGVHVPSLRTGESDRFWFPRTLVRETFDVIFFEYWRAAWPHLAFARSCQPWARTIVDSVDVHFVRERAELAFLDPGPKGRATIELNERQELEAYRGADAVVVVTPEDREALEAHAGMPPIYRIPLIMETKERAPGPRAPEVLFVGGFNHTPNIDGIVWFVRESWPAVRAAVPDATLLVVGNRPTPEVEALGQAPGVSILGYVPDTGPYLDRAAVVIAPLRFGAGMKGKVAEALARGAAVVTTSIGNQGFGAVSGEHLLVGDTAEDLAASIVALLRDAALAERLGRAGHDLAVRACSPEVVERDVERMLAAVASKVSPTPGQQLRSWRTSAVFAAGQAMRTPLRLRPVKALWGQLRPGRSRG
jgi:glycosyltransferase involved in cell wall biosynthesis